MQANDREEFETQLGRLCAGFNVPVTKHRVNAYWSGLAKMSLAQFSRVIDFALAEYGPDDVPPTKGIWRIHRQLRAPDAGQEQATEKKVEEDHLEWFANRLLFLHLSHRGGLGSTGRFVPGERHISGMNDCVASEELQACLKFKRQIVDEFTGFVREGDEDATPAAFYQWWISGLRRISPMEQRTIDTLIAASEHPSALKPFAATMARDVPTLEPEPA